jgi:hypothetical protein
MQGNPTVLSILLIFCELTVFSYQPLSSIHCYYRNQTKNSIGTPLLTDNQGGSRDADEWLNWNSEEKQHHSK